MSWYTHSVSTKKQKEKRTYADRREYLIKAVAKRRRKMRQMALEYGGGKCKICGYKKCDWSLTFHHLDPSQKDFGLSSRGITRSWEKTKAELEKCILLCMNCHAEVHHGVTKVPKGS
jgi:5-methylcytosine-specific restriction endonuclease McrA